MSYEKKYLKYKSKYLALINQLGSGEKSAKKMFFDAYSKNNEKISEILNTDKVKGFLLFDDISTQLESIFKQIYEKTGNDKNTIDWIIKSYINNTFGHPSSLENLGRYKDSIKKYNILHANIKGIKPMNEIAGLIELERFIENNEDNFKQIEEKKSKQLSKVVLQKKIKEKGEDDKEVILETDKVIIFKPTSENGAKYYGRNTKWCTTTTEYNQFDYYNGIGPIYIIQSKSDYKDKYQLAIESNQFMNREDSPVKIDYIKTYFNDEALNKCFDIFIKECKSIRVGHYPPKYELFSINDLYCLINLEKLFFGQYFNQPLDNYLEKLTNLKNLDLGSFNHSLGNSLDKLTKLHTLISKDFDKPLGNSLEKLTNLKTLELSYLTIETKTKEIKCSSLSLFSFSYLSDLILTKIQNFTFLNFFNEPLGNSLDKLTNLETLHFGLLFNQSLNNSLDKLINLKNLTFGVKFNESLGNSLDKLTKLKTLSFRQDFNQPLGNSLDKLTKLQGLFLGNNFKQPLDNSLDKLTNLQLLNLGSDFNKPLGNSLEKLSNLKRLYLSFGFNELLGNSLDNLTNLEYLHLGHNFNQPLGNSLDKLKKLECLYLGPSFNQPLGNSLDKLTNLQTLNSEPYIKTVL